MQEPLGEPRSRFQQSLPNERRDRFLTVSILIGPIPHGEGNIDHVTCGKGGLVFTGSCKRAGECDRPTECAVRSRTGDHLFVEGVSVPNPPAIRFWTAAVLD